MESQGCLILAKQLVLIFVRKAQITRIHPECGYLQFTRLMTHFETQSRTHCRLSAGLD